MLVFNKFVVLCESPEENNVKLNEGCNDHSACNDNMQITSETDLSSAFEDHLLSIITDSSETRKTGLEK